MAIGSSIPAIAPSLNIDDWMKQQSAQASQQGQYAAGVREAEIQAAAQKQVAQTQIQPQMAGLAFKKDVFGQLFPYYQQAFGSVLGQQGSGGGGFNPPNFLPGGGGGSAGGGGLPAPPEVPKYQAPQLAQAPQIDPSSGPVVSPSLLASQINAARATNDQSTATQIQQQQGALAGRGVGSQSPLGQSLAAQLQGANIGANATATIQAQQGAAKQNADYAQALNTANIQSTGTQNAAQLAANASAYNAGLGALMGGYGTQVGGLTSLAGTNEQAWAAWLQAQTSMRNALLGAISNFSQV